MSQEVKQIRIQSRVDTKENWTKENPILLDKEIGYERETGKYKIGRYSPAGELMRWNDLPYAEPGGQIEENLFKDLVVENSITIGNGVEIPSDNFAYFVNGIVVGTNRNEVATTQFVINYIEENLVNGEW